MDQTGSLHGEDDAVEDISIEGEWSGGSPDAEWGHSDISSLEEES